MGELREFVYIDDVSLNNHLSSLGQGVPEEVTQTAEDHTEKSGEASGSFLGIGGGAGYASTDVESLQRTLSITEPYRFETFIETLEEEDIDIYSNPDPCSLARGDVVEITGRAIPMSLFKIEVAIKTITGVINVTTQQSLKELDVDDAGELEEDEVEQLGIVESLIEKFTGTSIPLRISGDDYTYATTLSRDHLRAPPASEFVEEREYTLIGRAEQRIISDETWDPVLATNILSRYAPEQEAHTQMREQMKTVAKELNIDTDQDDWELSGHTAVIHPIALFW